ncbi:MAG: sigma-70 family RNA polymerase sigma factor [Planctomycetes bacterium]|nr:sigma-70 family RNA polymerase sigma factor [Planctomycetota bacterium]
MDLSELIDRYRGPLIGLIASWGCPIDDAVELAQDTFAEAYVHRSSLRSDRSDIEAVGRWLRGIARNLYRGWARSRRRRSGLLPLRAAADLAGEAPSTSARATEVQRAVERLPRKLRQAVLMHYLEEAPVRDIATVLGVPEKTVEGRLYRARQRLRSMLPAPTTPSGSEGAHRDRIA